MAETQKTYSIQRTALVGVLVVLLLTASFIVSHLMQSSQGTGVLIAIHDSDGAVQIRSLAEDGEFEVRTDLGYNIVRIEDGKASIVEADCPGHDCEHQPAISQPGEQLICLPHKLWIEVVSDEDSLSSNSLPEGVDVIAG